MVIADEAHRSQYDFIDGYARHMRDALPNASFVGFTGTPIELQDANTRAVFGDYISIYDIQRSVDDGATVPIYYESRLDALEGKAMIVCMSRRICVDLYRRLISLRPEWHDEDDGKGAVKIVMTGSAADPADWQPHIRNKARREALAQRFRDADDPFKIAIVRDMWLTGFDAPSLHTMYVDKPMRGHGLMQAIARVNRVFKDKPGGLVVDLKFALAAPHPETMRIRDDVGFFQQVSAALSKRAPSEARPADELDLAVRQIISRSLASEGVMDIFAAAGLEKPDISVLSDEFLSEVRGMERRNLAVELLQKLLRGEIALRRRKNVVQARSFAEMLEQSLNRYRNRAIEAAQVIEELIAIAKEMREASERGERLGLSDEELAFYDALGANDSAVQVLGDETLTDIARELVQTVRNNVTIDWTLRENVRANLRRLVRRILRKHGYPPDKREAATQTVIEQAEALSEGWALEA